MNVHFRVFADRFTQCVIRDSSVVDSSLAGDLTATPLTVSLIFCPMLSCRVSGMSLICFFTWHASSPCIIHLLAHGLQEAPCPECTLLTLCYMLASLLDWCQLQGMQCSILKCPNMHCPVAEPVCCKCNVQSSPPVLFCVCFTDVMTQAKCHI